jgi:S-adenosyl-L-homocysteine hydrolase
MVLDDAGDATKILHDKHPGILRDIRGISEETTTEVNWLYAMMRDGSLRAPATRRWPSAHPPAPPGSGPGCRVRGPPGRRSPPWARA